MSSVKALHHNPLQQDAQWEDGQTPEGQIDGQTLEGQIDGPIDGEKQCGQIGIGAADEQSDRFRETVLFLLINVSSAAQLHLRPLAATELAGKTPSHQLM